jgi:hypothetical protein
MCLILQTSFYIDLLRCHEKPNAHTICFTFCTFVENNVIAHITPFLLRTPLCDHRYNRKVRAVANSAQNAQHRKESTDRPFETGFCPKNRNRGEGGQKGEKQKSFNHYAHQVSQRRRSLMDSR